MDAALNDGKALCTSRWFTRGWTLQELIAPSGLMFLSCDWVCIGIRSDFANNKSQRTGIPVAVLEDNDFQPLYWCVAEKMAWVANRETTRSEDMAYCLLVLFNVSMPLLYVEGDNAFFRLQEEIIKHDNDYTIFLWKGPDAGLSTYRGMLAQNPSEFGNSKCQEPRSGRSPAILDDQCSPPIGSSSSIDDILGSVS